MKTTSQLLVVAAALGGLPLLADSSASPANSTSVARQATVGIQYNPAAQKAPAASAETVTSLPTVKVTEKEQNTLRDLDHDLQVRKWLQKPAVYSKPVGETAKLALLTPPKEGAHGKAEEPIVDLEW